MPPLTTTGSESQKPMPPIEDLEAPPPSLVDEYGSELQTLLYKTGVVSEHTRVTDQSSHDTTSI